MKKIVLALAALLGFCGVAHAQSTPPLATVVTACGTPPSTYTAGTNRPVLQDVNGQQCSSASGTIGTVTTVGTITNPVGIKGTDGSTISTTANPFPVTGVGVAQGSTSSGQTLSPIGCRTLNAPAADTTAQTNMPICALSGALIIYPYSNPENLVSGLTAAMTGTTSTSIIAAPASGLRNYVTNIVCTNSHATVSTFVIVQDGSGGTTFYEAYAAAVGGGFSINFPAPLRQPTTATALYVQDVTTGANVICSASGFKAP